MARYLTLFYDRKHETFNPKHICMAKNSTLYSNGSFISRSEKNLKEKALPDNQVYPGDAVIANIIAFSKALKIRKSREAGLIEIVLN